MVKKKTQTTTGKIENGFWIWPDGRKTHLRFIAIAVSKMRPLPVGFFEVAEKVNLRNLNQIVAKAKDLGLECTVEKP